MQALSAANFAEGVLPATLAAELARLPDHYNISVGQAAGVCFIQDQQCKVGPMSWGLIPSWEPAPVTRYSTQTARLSNAPSSRMYRRAWALRRCVVPMNGYYKWDRQSNPRQPYFIQAGSGEILFAAGLWSLWGNAQAHNVLSFTVLTLPNAAIPPPLVADGPQFVAPARLREWITQDAGSAEAWLRSQVQPQLEAYPVSRRVADRKRDEYSLLEPVQALEEFDTAFDPDENEDDDRD